jgi:hypothetical protein
MDLGLDVADSISLELDLDLTTPIAATLGPA